MSDPCFLICPYICILGDSTGDLFYYLIPQEKSCVPLNLAVSGHTPADGQADWEALPLDIRQKQEFIFVQLGLNGYSIPDYQSLINSINSTRQSNCRVYGVCMTPTRGSVIPSDYIKWLNLNEAIRGEGATPILGLYGYIDSHLAILGDADDYLIPLYDSGDGRHPNEAGNLVNVQEIVKVIT